VHTASILATSSTSITNISKALELFGGRPATEAVPVAERAKRIQPRDAAALLVDIG